MRLAKPLLSVLADGCFHGGEALGRQFGVSRTVIWKTVQALKERHIAIHAVSGRGYRLAEPVELLDRRVIIDQLDEPLAAELPCFEIVAEVDSTNRLAMDYARRHASDPYLCLAESQTAGRGRRGRSWQSPYARNIYLSLLWRFADSGEAPGGLALVTSVALLRAVHRAGLVQAHLKWPNDVLVGRRKLAGVLLEMTGESGGPCAVVMGIGLNICMPETLGQTIDQPWTDMAALLSARPSRNRMAACLISELFKALACYEREGMAPFIDVWREHDALRGKAVSLTIGDRTISGIARGVDSRGALRVESDGHLACYLSGDVSLSMAGSPEPTI